jgi:hypothetical protein
MPGNTSTLIEGFRYTDRRIPFCNICNRFQHITRKDDNKGDDNGKHLATCRPTKTEQEQSEL